MTTSHPSYKPVAVAALVLAFTAPNGNAFVPSVPTRNAGSNVYVNNQQHPRATSTPTPRGIDTSLSMVASGNLFERFFRVTKANVNKVVSSLENPEKVIVQAVDDMQVCFFWRFVSGLLACWCRLTTLVPTPKTTSRMI